MNVKKNISVFQQNGFDNICVPGPFPSVMVGKGSGYARQSVPMVVISFCREVILCNPQCGLLHQPQ